MNLDVIVVDISEAIQTNIKSAFFIYASSFGNITTTSEHKLMALNMFTMHLKKYLDENNLEVLSDYASIYALEPAFKEEYKKVSDAIQTIIKKRYV